MNFKNFGNEPPGDGGRSQGNFSLARQTSIYSLTFDELQSTIGGSGKDFGSMNMDELLKNIWSAEETQTVGSASTGVQGVVPGPGGYLQKQGSLTLPRTLSQKTVDEVWRDMSNGGKDVSGFGGLNLQQRQQTLGEMTLEEFLVKAGVVREENLLTGKPDNMSGLFGNNMLNPGNNPGFGMGFQQMGQNTGLVGNRIPESNNNNDNQFSFHSANLPLNADGIRTTQQQQQQQQLLPKRPTMTYTSPMPMPITAQLGTPGIRGGITGISESGLNSSLAQNVGLQGGGTGRVGGGGIGAVTVAATASPVVSSNGFGKNNGDISSVSPVPYVFNGGLRGRKGSGVEKVVERRQRRMIKNRESAARSRARKQVNFLKFHYIYIKASFIKYSNS